MMNTHSLDTIGWVLVHSLWQFAAIGCLAWLFNLVSKRQSSSFRYNGLLAAMMLMAACPILTTILVSDDLAGARVDVQDEPDSLLSVNDEHSLSLPTSTETEGQTSPLPASDALPPVGSSVTPSPESKFSIRDFNLSAVATDFAQRIKPWLALIVGVWCVGVLFFGMRLSIGWWRIRRLLGQSKQVTDASLISLLTKATDAVGVRRQLQLLTNGSIASPIVVGVLRSTIVIPASFLSGVSPELVEAIFAHELSHVRRYDYPINLMQSVVETLFFYHPMVWWLSGRLREERENCCDDMAASAMRNPVTVGRALLAIEELRGQDLSPALGAGGSSLLSRIQRLLNKQSDRQPAGTAGSLIAVGVLVSLLAGIAGMTIANASNPDEGETVPAARDAVDIDDLTSALPNQLLPESRNVYSLRFTDAQKINSVAYGEGNAKQGSYPRVREWSLQSKEMLSEVLLQWEQEWTRYTSELVLADDLVCSSLGDELGVWNASSGQLLRRLKPAWEEFGDLTLRHVVATPTGDRVACSGLSNSTAIFQPGHIYVWNTRTGELVREIKSERTGYVRSFALSDDGQYVAAWPAKGGVGIWNVESGEQIFKFKNENPPGSWPGDPMHPSVPDQVLGLQFSHDGRTLAIGDLVGVKLIDIKTGVVQQSMNAPVRYNSPTFLFSPDDRFLLRYGVHFENRQESLLWNLISGEQLAALPINASAAAFSTNGDTLAVGRSDGEQAIAVWNLKTSSDTSGAVEQRDNIFWYPRGTAGWTTGVKVVKRPSHDDPTLTLQYLLRNDSDSRRTADLSFESGPGRFFVRADHRIEGWSGGVGSKVSIEQFDIEARDVLSDPQFRQEFDFSGLEAAEYEVRLQSYFSLPADQPGTRHGIPFDHRFPVRLDASPIPETTGNREKRKDTGLSSVTHIGNLTGDHRPNLTAIRWGKVVSGLRVGIAWTDHAGDAPPVFEHGRLVSTDLYVQNVSDSEVEFKLTLPHSMDGWGFSIRDSSGKHMRRNQTIFTGIEPQRDLFASINPGEIKRMTGSPSEFDSSTSDRTEKAIVNRLQFKISSSKPAAEVVPPYTYQLPTGNYTVEAFVHVRSESSPAATLVLETVAAAFQVLPDDSGEVDRDKNNDAKVNTDGATSGDNASRFPWRAFGRVVDGDGKPLAGVTIRAATGVGTLIGGGKTKTDANGLYDLRFGLGMMFGDMDGKTPHPQTQVAQITAHLPGHFEKNLSRHGNGIGGMQPVPVEDLEQWSMKPDQVVLPGKPRQLNFVMLPATKVSGTLVDENDKPLKDYSVSLRGDELPPGSSVISQVRTDANGRFAIDGIPISFPYQFVIRKPKEQLKPPWNDSWASVPIHFRDPGDADFAPANPSLRSNVDVNVLSAKVFRIQIHGPGVHERQATKKASTGDMPVDHSGAGLSADSISLEHYTLELTNASQ